MNKPLKLIRVGNSTGVILPKEVLEKLHLSRGDALFMSEIKDGGFRVTPHDPDFVEVMAKAENIMREDRDILHVLSK